MRLVTAIISPLIWTMFGMIHQDLSYIKEQIAKHKEEGKNSRTLAYNPRCEVMFKAVRLDGSEIVGVFDAQLVRDALECVGKHPVCYLGFNRNKSRPFPFLMVGSDDTLWDFSFGVRCAGDAACKT